MAKKLLLCIGIVLFTNIIYASTPPTIFNFRINASEPNKVYFDSNKPVSGLSVKGFTISGKKISGLTINKGQTTNHYFTVSSSFTFWDNNTIRLGEVDGSVAGDGTIHDFTLTYIKNNIPEPNASINRYVTMSATGGGNGLTEGTAWTLTEAASNATAGMTVWIKAGNYGNTLITLSNDGTVSNPIKFIGYKNTINDINSMYFNYSTSSTLDSSEMPLLRGNNTGNAITISGDYRIIKNIQSEDHLRNFYFGDNTHNVLIENSIANHTASAGTNFRTSDNGSNVRIKGCIAVNGGDLNYFILGKHNLVTDSFAYSDLRGDSDYFFAVRGSNSILINNHAERGEHDRHGGHGFTVYASGITCEYNLIENAIVKSITMAIEARHKEVKYNVYRNISIDRDPLQPKNYTGGIFIINGASYNVFDRISVNDGNTGISFYAGVEDPSATSSGYHNIIKNSTFSNMVFGIVSRKDGQSGLDRFEIDNIVVNCIFYNNDYLFWEESGKTIGTNNKIINSIISNTIKQENLNNRKKGWVYENSNFYKNTKSITPKGNNNISVDPKFENEKSGNFRLKSNSPLIDAGKNLDYLKTDFEGNARPQGSSTDIGVYEYNDNTTGAINVDAGDDVEICKGSETILTATGNGDFLWSTGETTPSITVSPSETTNYKVTVSSKGNSKSDEVTVTISEQPEVTLGDNLSICSGNEVTLTAEGNGNFLWSTGETTSSITVNPSETTEYTVTASSFCGDETLSVSDTILVKVTPRINLNAGNDVTVCFGTEVTLTAKGNGNFLWSTGETTASITVNPTETTVYSVTSGSGVCEITDEVTVTISEQPEVTLGDDLSICSGNEVTLTAEGNGNFLWSTGETTSSISVNPSETTEYTVTASSYCGDIEVTDDILVTVTDPIHADAGIDVTIEPNESTILTASGGTSYLWSTGETTASISVQPENTTIYTVEVGNGTSCGGTDDVKVTVENIPLTINNGEDITICKGDELVLQAQGSSNYLWSNGQMDSRITVDPEITTNYTVSAQENGILETTSITVTVEDCSTNRSIDYDVYPNPTADILNITIPLQKESIKITVHATDGKILFIKNIKADNNGIYAKLNLSHLSNGIYFIKMVNDNFNQTKKIIIL